MNAPQSPAEAPGPAGGPRPPSAHHKQTMSFALKPEVIEALKKRSGSHSEYVEEVLERELLAANNSADSTINPSVNDYQPTNNSPTELVPTVVRDGELEDQLRSRVRSLEDELTRLHQALAREQTITHDIQDKLALPPPTPSPTERKHPWWRFWG